MSSQKKWLFKKFMLGSLSVIAPCSILLVLVLLWWRLLNSNGINWRELNCRCTKRGYTFCTPITVHGQSEPRAPPHQARQGRWARVRPKLKRTTTPRPRPEEQRGRSGLPRQDPCRETVLAAPARPLPRWLVPHLRSKSPLSPLPPKGKDSGDIPMEACRSSWRHSRSDTY